MYCPVCGEEHTAPPTKYGSTRYCPNCLSIITTLMSNPDKKQKMPDWDPMNRPKCTYCGKSENVYRTKGEGEFYCIGCDTYFKPMDFPRCPRCKTNDHITVKSEGRYPRLRPVYFGSEQYKCHRCKLKFNDESRYREMYEFEDYSDDEDESGGSYSDDLDYWGDEPGDDNPND